MEAVGCTQAKRLLDSRSAGFPLLYPLHRHLCQVQVHDFNYNMLRLSRAFCGSTALCTYLLPMEGSEDRAPHLTRRQDPGSLVSCRRNALPKQSRALVIVADEGMKRVGKFRNDEC